MRTVCMSSPWRVLSAVLVVGLVAVTFAAGQPATQCPPYNKAVNTACPGIVGQACRVARGCPGGAQVVKNGDFGWAPTADKKFVQLGTSPADDVTCYEAFTRCTAMGNGCIPDQTTKSTVTKTQYLTKDCPAAE